MDADVQYLSLINKWGVGEEDFKISVPPRSSNYMNIHVRTVTSVAGLFRVKLGISDRLLQITLKLKCL